MRGEINRLLWKLWSPKWEFDDETYRRTAASFDNPDFVEVAVHAYRHRMGNASGDPRYAKLEAQLAALPKIGVPAIVIHGAVDEVNPPRNQKDISGISLVTMNVVYLKMWDTIRRKKIQKHLLKQPLISASASSRSTSMPSSKATTRTRSRSCGPSRKSTSAVSKDAVLATCDSGY